jgi:hypothetical protein
MKIRAPNHKSELLRPVLSAVMIAVVAGGSAPWWYSSIFRREPQISPKVVLPVSVIERKLFDANVILSDGLQEDVRGWLRQDPAIIALADECMKLLDGRRLIDAVPLDVIANEYKKQYGKGYGEYLTAEHWHDATKLRKAVVRAWNGRYPDKKVSEFSALLTPDDR